jgi:hypothetical protein
MMNGRKTRKAGADDSDRKHLTGREVGTAHRGDEGQQERGPRPLLSAPDAPPRPARVGGLPDKTRSGGHGESSVVHFARLKAGLSTAQPLRGDELGL